MVVVDDEVADDWCCEEAGEGEYVGQVKDLLMFESGYLCFE